MNWEKLKKPDKQMVAYIAALCAMGILIVWLSSVFGKPKPAETTGQTPFLSSFATEDAPAETNALTSFSSEAELEARLQEILSSVDGAGEVRVMLTFAETIESVFLKQSNSEHIATLRDKNGAEIPLTLKELSPKISGVLIVAKGGGDVKVRDALTKAVEAVLGVEAHKIQVLKMK